MRYHCDLHIHTCLSPCGSLDQSPAAVVRAAKDAGLDAIAIADHNSALNAAVTARLARDAGLACLCGLEVTTIEEAHVLCLFDAPGPAEELGEIIYRQFPERARVDGLAEEQLVVDEEERVLGSVDRFLVAASAFSVAELEPEVLGRGGLFIPSHLDRELFSLESQLGFLPEGRYDAVELTRPPENQRTYLGYPVIATSDAHAPGQIGRRHTRIEAETFSVAAIREALAAGRATPVWHPVY
ncbi:PHP domain-containing protein [Kiritimatiella glycovorans]|uniref:Histidinol-phosphatase n=1 Tax=Kiritimatiella glycovorans TaxID=1307763 RepID=A0A0G3EHK8_9BACT|nr:PHP domain-containing protein [Kiritimatiella glycovorans]AKJ63679.1 histidinol-phosphatase [Kiritimatiella glycovorans]